MKTIHCDWCEHTLLEGETYNVRLLAGGRVGAHEPNWEYAARLYQCSRCADIEDDLLDVDGAFERYDE